MSENCKHRDKVNGCTLYLVHNAASLALSCHIFLRGREGGRWENRRKEGRGDKMRRRKKSRKRGDEGRGGEKKEEVMKKGTGNKVNKNLKNIP